MILIPNGCQNGANIDAKTNQKSMPNMWRKRLNIIKNQETETHNALSPLSRPPDPIGWFLCRGIRRKLLLGRSTTNRNGHMDWYSVKSILHRIPMFLNLYPHSANTPSKSHQIGAKLVHNRLMTRCFEWSSLLLYVCSRHEFGFFKQAQLQASWWCCWRIRFSVRAKSMELVSVACSGIKGDSRGLLRRSVDDGTDDIHSSNVSHTALGPKFWCPSVLVISLPF